MFFHIRSKSEVFNCGDMLVKADNIKMLDLVTKIKKGKKIYLIQFKIQSGFMTSGNCTESYDDEAEARKRLAEVIKLITGQDNADQIAADYYIEAQDDDKCEHDHE